MSGVDPASAPSGLPAGTVTFLLTDVEGSTRLWERDEAVAAQLISRQQQLLSDAVARWGGKRPVEQGEGDSIVAAFASAPSAVAAALDAQLALHQEPWPEGADVRVRMAMHTGPAQPRPDGTYAGPTLIRCARLRELAHGSQTLLSGATYDATVDDLPQNASVRALGVHRLKDLGRPERVWQLGQPNLPVDFPPLRSVAARLNNLPTELTSLVGRDVAITELAELLQRHRVVTLTGPGGVGKSRLAAHAAAHAATRHAEGAWWVDLAAVAEPARVAHALTVVFGLRKEHGRPVLATLAEHLEPRDTLIVLDNCEQVLDAVVSLVDGLVQAAPGVRFLATSREPLGAQGELAWRVPSLSEDAAIQLFAERAAAARPGFEPEEVSDAVAEIARRLDGLPLAIELAAARTRMMHPVRIAAALDDRFRLLTGGPRGALSRQQTLEACVAWSYDMLDVRERAALQRLAVFRDGFAIEAAEAVCADGVLIEEYDVLDLLTRLVDKSLAQADANVEGRYRLLETIRQFAELRLLDDADVAPARERHLEYYLALAELAAPHLTGPQSVEWMALISREHENLRAAFDWADGTGRGEPCQRMVAALAVFWELRSHFGRGGRWFDRALSHDTGASPTRAHALWAAAHVALYSDDVATAHARASEAVALADAVGDPSSSARAHNTLAYSQIWFDPAGGRDALHRSRELAESVGDVWAVGDAVKMLTISWMVQEDWAEAEREIHELGRIAASSGNRFFTAWQHYGLGYIALQRGDLPAAESQLTRALTLSDEIGDPATRGLTVAALGEIDRIRGRYDAASARLEPFVRVAEATGATLGLPFAMLTLAHVHMACGRHDLARAIIERLLSRFNHDNGLPLLRAWSLCAHAELLIAARDAEATSVLVVAHRVADAITNRCAAARTDHLLGQLALASGNLGEADQLLHRALAVRDGAGLLIEVIESLEALAAVAAAYESYGEALRLDAAAAAARERLGAPRGPQKRTDYGHLVAVATEALGPDEAATAISGGTGLTLSAAVAYAARARGERKRPSSGWESLTPTEVDVVRLAAQGLTNPEIGEQLFIARTTVKTHLAHVFAKLGVSTRAELAHLATHRGLL